MPRLVLCLGPLYLTSLPLAAGATSIGRKATNTLCLEQATISGEHARLLCSETGAAIEDLGSTNGTRLNGQALLPASAQALADGDLIAIGAYQLHYQSDSAPLYLLRQLADKARELPLTRARHTLGNKGVALAEVCRQGEGHVLRAAAMGSAILLNGHGLGEHEQALKAGDVLEFSGRKMVYALAEAPYTDDTMPA